jgi:flagellin-specific chaperone FliS
VKFKSLEIIKALEEQVETGYSLKIFKGYVAINKRGIEKLIDELYANLPDDVKAAREYLERTNHQISRKEPSKVFDNIKELETQIENPLQIATHIVVNVKEMEKLIDKIYSSLPSEIQEANILDKQ